ncbi:hypothetical protein [Kitasatospora camelliae]|uniref:CYTH domain-containing protein n=1 Tax=Kitasatospora camelliae TaxID=3156397 RepID=A0AAU8JSF0_9ACTN
MADAAHRPVEIKVLLSDEAVGPALQALDLDADDSRRRRIYFWERPAPGPVEPRLPLLEAGLVIRLRKEVGGSDDDLTVKLRPCDPDRLPEEWRADRSDGDWEFTIEEDWSGRDRAPAASLKRDGDFPRPTGDDPGDSGQPAFNPEQRDLLAGTGHRDLGRLTALGPVEARQWKPPLADLLHPVTVERWTVEDQGLDFLELSLRARPADAEAARRQLVRALSERGLASAERQRSKTRAVLAALAAEALGG